MGRLLFAWPRGQRLHPAQYLLPLTSLLLILTSTHSLLLIVSAVSSTSQIASPRHKPDSFHHFDDPTSLESTSTMTWFRQANTNPDFMKESIDSKLFNQSSITKLSPNPKEDKFVKGDAYFIAGLRNVVVERRNMEQGWDREWDQDVWVESSIDASANRPFILVKNILNPAPLPPTSDYAGSLLEFAVILDKVKIYNARNESVFEKHMQDIRWGPLTQLRNIMVPSRNNTDVIRVFALSALDSSMRIKFGFSGESLEEENGGINGFLTPRNAFVWIHLHRINSEFLTVYNTIELDMHICSGGDSTLIDPKNSAADEHDSFVSVEQKVTRSHWDANKAYGYVSWDRLLQQADQKAILEIQETIYSEDPLRNRSPQGILLAKNAGCKRLQLLRHNAGTLRKYQNPVDLTWGLAIGIGKIPPALVTWKNTALSIIIAVLGIGAAIGLIIWYHRRIKRMDILEHSDSLGRRKMSISALKDFPSPLANQIQVHGGYGSTTAEIIRKGSDHQSRNV